MSSFDFNNDGKVDFGEHFLTYVMIEEFDKFIISEKKSLFSGDDDSWRDFYDYDFESDIDPDDFETEEEYLDALAEAMLCSEESDDF